MEIATLHHVSLPVADLERSRRFYKDVLGLEEIARPPFPFPGAWLRLGDRELHLIGGSGPRSTARLQASEHHFAIRVTSFRAALERLRAKGYREGTDPDDPMGMLVYPKPVTGYPQVYVLDPDRHLIEINAAVLDE